jgi:hypothetical protein
MFPHALDAEEALLGCILIDPSALFAVRTLTPDDFYREAHATIFATMRQLDADGMAVDVVTVSTRLERTGQLERAGGFVYVNSLPNAAPTSLNAVHYANLVRQASQGRKVLEVAGDLAAIGYHSDEPAREAVRAVEALAAQAEEETLDLSPEEARARLAALAPTLVRVDDLLRQEFPKTLWVVPDLLPEGLTLLAAKPKLGKSWLALGLALAVASGGVALGKTPVEAGDVLYLALEDSPKRLRNRTEQLLQGEPPPSRLEVTTRWPRLDDGGLRLLEVWLLGHPEARLLILDTLAKIRGHARSATLYGEDYASLEQVQALAHARSVSILVIHHTGKESREDALDEVNATQGLNGVADNVLVLRRERGKPQARLIGDGRELLGIEQTLQFDPTTGAWRLAEPVPDQPKTPERAEILDLLKTSDGPLTPKQIGDALGKHHSTIRNILAKMVRDGDIKMVGYAKYIPIDSVDTVDSLNSSLSKRSKEKHTDALFEKKRSSSEPPLSTVSTLSIGVQRNEPSTLQDESAAGADTEPAPEETALDPDERARRQLHWP